jgi:hypothetical protein
LTRRRRRLLLKSTTLVFIPGSAKHIPAHPEILAIRREDFQRDGPVVTIRFQAKRNIDADSLVVMQVNATKPLAVSLENRVVEFTGTSQVRITDVQMEA